MTKKKYPWRIWTVFLMAAVILGILYYYGIFAQQKEKTPVYSVILYQNTNDEWTTLVEGTEQAEEDLDIHINYVYLAKEDTAEEQAAAIRREINGGTSGILMAPVDTNGLKRILDTMYLKVPVLCVETGAGEAFPVLRADDYAMGKALGEEILRDMDSTGRERKVTILTEYLERDSVQMRYQGLTDVLKSAEPEVRIEERTRMNRDFSLGRITRSVFYDESPYLVALDKYVTEQAAASWTAYRQEYENGEFSCRIYGIGNTAQTVNALDNENIAVLMYQNEFNMGYQGITCLAEKRKKKWIEENTGISYRMVTKESLYEDENERLLFSNT